MRAQIPPAVAVCLIKPQVFLQHWRGCYRKKARTESPPTKPLRKVRFSYFVHVNTLKKIDLEPLKMQWTVSHPRINTSAVTFLSPREVGQTGGCLISLSGSDTVFASPAVSYLLSCRGGRCCIFYKMTDVTLTDSGHSSHKALTAFDLLSIM